MNQQQQGYYSVNFAMYDQAFRERINAFMASNAIPPNVLTQIATDWELKKSSCIEELCTRYKLMGGPNITAVQNMINKFIERGIGMYCRTPNNMGYQQLNIAPAGMPMNNMQQQMYVPQQQYPYPSYGTQPMQQQYNSIANTTAPQPAMPGTVDYSDVGLFDPPPPSQAPAIQATAAPTTPIAEVIPTTTEYKYARPYYDDSIDDMWTSCASEVTLAEGDIKITHMVSHVGIPYDLISLNLTGAYSNTDAVMAKVKQMVDISSKPVHISITYNRLVTIDVPFENVSNLFKGLHKSIAMAARNKNKAKYLTTIFNAINTENRGTADTIDEFLMGELEKYASMGCITSDLDRKVCFQVKRLHDLIKFFNKDTGDENVKSWCTKPNFEARLLTLCDQTIKHIVTKSKALDPGVIEDLQIILKNHNIIHDTEDGTPLSIEETILPVIDKYIAATPEDRLTQFGVAGERLAECTTLCIPNQKLIYTNFYPEETVGYQNANIVIMPKDLAYGGEPESELEHLLLDYSVGESPCDMLVNYENNISILYKIVLTIDNWLRIYR